jgi:hypothetical protein
MATIGTYSGRRSRAPTSCNKFSKSVNLGQYILNPCEQGVIFVFNVPSWMCLSVCLYGQKLDNAWKILPVTARSLWSIWS